MESVTIHEVKARLSQLVARAAKGETFIVTKAGKPVARITAIDSPTEGQGKRIGFMAGEFTIPDNFDRLGQEDIAERFGG